MAQVGGACYRNPFCVTRKVAIFIFFNTAERTKQEHFKIIFFPATRRLTSDVVSGRSTRVCFLKCLTLLQKAMNVPVTQPEILARLERINEPQSGDNIVARNMVSNIVIGDGKVMFSISVPAERADAFEPLRESAQSLIESMEGVEKAIVTLTAERKPGAAPAQPQGPQTTQPTQAGPKATAEPAAEEALLPGVRSVIAVASGKGGVGKSTTAVNLALGLKRLGAKVGVLDADIYGPSMPRLLGISGHPEGKGRVLKPMQGFGLKVMSIGFLVEEDTPVIWRGPMVISALTQMMRDIDWGELDVLMVDMPPGTGDAQLTMAQKVPMAGAIIVSTPQDLALVDARKGLNMFRRVDVPILGIIENMSTFICPECGTASDIFGTNGARLEAERLGVPFLGAVPLHMDIRANSDAGTPVTITEPDSPHARAYLDIAGAIQQRLNEA